MERRRMVVVENEGHLIITYGIDTYNHIIIKGIN